LRHNKPVSPVTKRKSPVAILAHGAGSSADFLACAFPADRLGVSRAHYLENRTGDVQQIKAALLTAARDIDAPVLLGGVSLGAHAATLALPHAPKNVVGGVLALPAWTGSGQPVAELTAVAAEAIAALGTAEILTQLPPADWVTHHLRLAWAQRTDAELARELANAAQQDGPSLANLRGITVPVGLVKLEDDPLHPAAVADLWAREIPAASTMGLARDEPGTDLAVFADAARAALRAAFARRETNT
jgi:pimeloyl-ACP methyl ester carboxylesterase